MKSLQKGFVSSMAAIIIVAIIAIGGGSYVYISKKPDQDPARSQPTLYPSSIISSEDIKDFDTCMDYAKNIPTRFDIVFAHGSNINEVRKFAADFQKAYPRAELKVSSEQDYLENALAHNAGKIKTAYDLDEYKKGIIAQANSQISINVPIIDLGSKKDFDNFISQTLKSYQNIKFQQYAGSSPDNTLTTPASNPMQKYVEDQCDYKYKKMTDSERAMSDLETADSSIQLALQSTIFNATEYYQERASYAAGSLALNNGVCSDTGVYGLKKSLDSIVKISGNVYCYASATSFAVSAPLKSNPNVGYCTDSTGFNGITTSPTAANKGYCVEAKKVSQDISSCRKKGITARERWICVGDIVDPFPPFRIKNIIGPYATPVSQKIDFCKTFKGIEADYCFSSIVKAGWGLNVDGSPDAATVCKMVSNQNPWFKEDCEK
ncbi:MAG: hypothetical protein AAB917_01355 [Patescibacteria group bacterium]